jgi:serine/threonine protein kinase
MEPLKSQDPKSIGQWKLIGRLGSGGMGIVYLAEKNIQRVALKVVQNFMDSPEIRARLQREVELMGKIKSDRVAKVIDSDVEDEFAWIATEFIDGPDLKTYVESNGVLNEEDWIGLSLGIFQGLKEIHAQGIIHRDIKPSNILISNKGPILIDFGIAQGSDSTSLTSTGLVAGSPAWLSPEQIHGAPLTNATDLFSAGSVLHFAGSGISPWGEQTSTTTPVVFNRILKERPNLSSLTENQKHLVLKLLEKDPQKRINANQALDILKDLPGNKTMPISSENFEPELLQLKKKTKLPPLTSIAGGIVLVGAVGALIVLGFKNSLPETTTSAQVEVIQTPTPMPTVTKENEVQSAETVRDMNIEFRDISSTGWTKEADKKIVASSILDGLQKISKTEWVRGQCEWSDVREEIRSEGKLVEFQTNESGKWVTIVGSSQATGWNKFTKYSTCEDPGTEKWEYFDPNFASIVSNLNGDCRKYRVLSPETLNFVQTIEEWCVSVS